MSLPLPLPSLGGLGMTRNSEGTRSNLEVSARKRAYKEDSTSACSKASLWWK